MAVRSNLRQKEILDYGPLQSSDGRQERPGSNHVI